MVLYRLFVLAWAIKCVFSLGGSVSCWQNNCLPCRKYVPDMVWSKNISDAECNCTNWEPNVKVFNVKRLNETSGQCMKTEWTEFNVLKTGFRGRNIPFRTTDVVMRPARVYVKAKASCASRAFANYTQGVVRVHGHFGIKLEISEVHSDVHYMINGSWVWADYADGDFFDDAYGSDPFHEFIFDLRLESTTLYYNYRRLVSTELHASKTIGGIQLDGASGPWMNFVTLYDAHCEVNTQCEFYRCDKKGDCYCVDTTEAPLPEVEEENLLYVVLVIMITNILCLVAFTCGFRCYAAARTDEEESRRSKRASSMFRGSYHRRSTGRFQSYRSNRSDSGRGSDIGLNLQYNRDKPRRRSRSKDRSKNRISKDNHTLGDFDYGEKVKEPKEKPKTPNAPPKPKLPKKSVSAKEPQPKPKKPRKKPKNNPANRHNKQAPASEAGTVEMVKPNKRKKKKKNARTKKSKDQVELNHVKQAKKKSKKNPPVVAHRKRKDSEPKAEAQSFSQGSAASGPVPNLKNSFAKSSSSSDIMIKEETMTSKTASSERDLNGRVRSMEAEGYVKLYE